MFGAALSRLGSSGALLLAAFLTADAAGIDDDLQLMRLNWVGGVGLERSPLLAAAG